MINVIIKRVVIENFLSFKSASYELDNSNKIILVRGINEADGRESNGSGKSALFESIIYGLYGITSRGNPQNKYSDDELRIEIDLEVSNHQYKIIRFMKSIDFYKDGDLVSSSSTKTATQAAIDDLIPRDIIIRLMRINTEDILFSRMNHSSRRNYLSQLINLSEYEVEFDSYINAASNDLSELRSKLDRAYNITRGSSNQLQSRINRLSNEIDASKSELELDNLRAKLAQLDPQINQLQQILANNESTESELRAKVSSLSGSYQSVSMTIRSLESKRAQVAQGTCPTCHQSLPVDTTALASIDQELSEASNQVTSIQNDLKNYQSSLDQYNSVVRSQRDLLSSMTKQKLALVADLSKSESKSSTLSDEVAHLAQELDEASKLLDELIQATDELQHYQDQVAKVKRLKSNYLNSILDKKLANLNHELARVSELTNLPVVSFNIDAKKVDILVGDRLIDSLSSGERRRVDILIALVFMRMSNYSLNLLVLDEIFDTIDNLDEIMNIIIDATRGNTFIVSHNKSHNVSYDSIWLVRKVADGDSRLEVDNYASNE